jgi:hypothetical protein
MGLGADLLGLVDRAAGVVEAGLDGALEVLALLEASLAFSLIAADVAHADLGHPR